MGISGSFLLLCAVVAVASLIALKVAIEHRNVEAVLTFVIAFICSLTPLAGRRYWIRTESVDVDLITNLGIAGLVCFLLGLFFLFYPKGKNDS